MKAILGIFFLIVGLLAAAYSYSEYQGTQDLKNGIEYKTAKTADNLAYNYLGVENENYLSKEVRQQERRTIIIAVGSLIAILFGIVLTIKGFSGGK
jgi:uncharacterized membrane protein YidH (DUF202 family)